MYQLTHTPLNCSLNTIQCEVAFGIKFDCSSISVSILDAKKRKSKWDQSAPGSTGSSPKRSSGSVGAQAILNAQIQAETEKLLKLKK